MVLDTLFTAGEEMGYPGRYIVPAFVNAHTHLELTHQLGVADREPENFPIWVNQLVSASRGSTEETFRESYRNGLSLSVRHGSATVLDHCRRADYLLPERRDFPLRGTTAYEFSGFEDYVADESFRTVLDIRAKYTGEIRAISPVAPHSVSGDLYSLSIRYARENGLLLCLHLAETAEEVEFLEKGTGPFVDYMVRFKPRDMSAFAPPGCTPIEFMERLGGFGKNTLAVHCNVLTGADIEILARSGTSVVHCPGSYKFFGHTSFRLEDLLRAGVNVCLGTDSLASNDSLSVLDAMRDMRRDYDWLTDDEIFRMGTVNGYKAMNGGEAPETWPPDFCVFPWVEGKAPAKVTKEAILHDLLMGTRHPVAVVIGGKTVYEEGRH